MLRLQLYLKKKNLRRERRKLYSNELPSTWMLGTLWRWQEHLHEQCSNRICWLCIWVFAVDVMCETWSFQYACCLQLPSFLDWTWRSLIIDHFTVVCLVTLPMNASKAGGDLACFDKDLCHLIIKCQVVSVTVRTCWFALQKQWGQNKVAYMYSLAAIQRPDACFSKGLENVLYP